LDHTTPNEEHTFNVRFEVFTAVKIQVKVFQIMMLCRAAVGY